MLFTESWYVAVFAAAAIACFGSLWRLRRLDNAEIRRGLVALLVLNGLWALAEISRLLVPSFALKIRFYLLGLVVGFATVGAWLYFCSAYAGHDYHQNTLLRWGAVGLYLAIVAIKFTNPLHQQYFTASLVETPFPHLAIDLLPLHWVVTGLAYVLAGIGFYMLYNVLYSSRYATTSLGLVMALAGLPVGLTVAAYAWPTVLLGLNYEPLGVGAFAVGAVYFVEEKFVAVPTFGRQQVIDNIHDPVVILDREGVLRDYNPAATSAFPALEGQKGRPLAAVVPALLEAADEELLTLSVDGRERHYLRDESDIAVGASVLGRAVVFKDVTDVERQRRQLQRQNEQLDDFADAITHELRNTLAIIDGNLDIAVTNLPAESDESVEEVLSAAGQAADRMERVVNDLSILARHGQTLDDVAECPFRETVERAWADATVEDLTVTVEGDGIVEAEASRLAALFRETFQFAAATDSTDVTVALSPGQLTVRTDGEPIPPEQAAMAFEYGAAVPNAEAGMSLPNVRTLARIHGWEVRLDETNDDGGVRLLVEGVTTDLS